MRLLLRHSPQSQSAKRQCEGYKSSRGPLAHTTASEKAFSNVGQRLHSTEAWTELKPTVLLATTCRWYPTARLAMALANAGFKVEAVAPPRHPLGNTRAVRRIHTYHDLMPLMSFANAIAATKPDFIVPGDDLATRHLHQLYYRERRQGKRGVLCTLIERSLGAPESFPVVYARTAFMELAQEEGVRVPRTEVIANTHDLRGWVKRVGFPSVLKANGTSGGDGVRLVYTLEEAERAFRALQAPPLLARAFKRAVLDRDKTLVWPSLLRRRSGVNAQAFVAGREATSAIACWDGIVLAALHFEVLNKAEHTGPATVVRLIENAEMSSGAEKIVRRLNLSGLHGLDFMLEADTGNAYLIEINPRATQVGHLTLGPGRDLPAALCAAVSGEAVQAARKITEDETITLFPQEWIRDPASKFLYSGYHDVPWEEPDLVRACVRSRRKQSAWYSQQNWVQAVSAARLPRF
jgi:formate-dependent phosphoribosylglycinamide formyltransferase (GAR transformylase)